MILALAAAVLAPSASGQCDAIRAMTYNIRLDTEADGENRWDKRRHFFIEQINIVRPDILGLQEVVDGQLQDLKKAFPHHLFVGVARDDGKSAGEYSSLAFDRRRYRAADQGTFWLSATPDRPSKGWDASFIRIATWARLVSRRNGSPLLVVNTHLDNEGAVARRQGALLIREWLDKKYKTGTRVLVMGDFNSLPDAPPLAELTSGSEKFQLRDSYAASLSAPVGTDGTFNGFRPNPDNPPRIDYVLADSRWQVDRYAVLNWPQAGRVASDHFPVIVDLSDPHCGQKGK